jgi:hypothetical protein
MNNTRHWKRVHFGLSNSSNYLNLFICHWNLNSEPRNQRLMNVPESLLEEFEEEMKKWRETGYFNGKYCPPTSKHYDELPKPQ